MCGIAGFINSKHTAERNQAEILSAMAQKMRDRGPDDCGIWLSQNGVIGLAHTRLSIIDTSSAGHQPMVSSSGKYVISFNGEIYNHLDLREQLRKSGCLVDWQGRSDTETLLESFEYWGIEKTLERCVGMFALALWDQHNNSLTLARDRLGEKPLYYGWQGSTFIFGSVLSTLRAHPEFVATVDRGALALFLRHNYVPCPYSIYQNIYKLPPASYLQLTIPNGDFKTISVDSVTIKSYWSLGLVAQIGICEQFLGSDQDALVEFEHLLHSAVKGQMEADVPLGSLLSGGLDSTAIATLMQINSSTPVQTFTIGFSENEYDETAHASTIAKYLGTNHTELRLSGADALNLVPQMPLVYDEPFADPSQLPTYLVMKLARQGVTVALSGDGGDELLGGYNRYLYVPKVWKWAGPLPRCLRNFAGMGMQHFPYSTFNWAVAPLAKLLNVSQPSTKLHKLGQRISEMRSIDDLYSSLVSEWSDVPNLVIGETRTQSIIGTRACWPDLANPVARMMALDSLTYLPDDILVKVDRAAMAVSLETRAPFLDHRLIEFAWTLPTNMKIRNGSGKWLLRQLLDKYVPRELTERPKMGFSIPLDEWLRGPLKDWAENLLSEQRLRQEGYFHPEPIRRVWEAHLYGKGSFGNRLWSILMFQSWLERCAVDERQC